MQITKSFDSEVTGVCSTRNADMVRSRSARSAPTHVVDYKGEYFTEGRRRYKLRNFVCGVNAVGSGGPPELLPRTDGRTRAAE